ncbi:hypothetical protein PanWU01x14_062920 [Parasponia andersonii]|uniref:Uncharacterized protein n=1 Tax=Parasponia andersonii TaxID=3476 RepID=A0A2P5DHU1_PARAD|nr:hypothetical protein PanWU01x14_062920 [Parasponia andersonii]
MRRRNDDVASMGPGMEEKGEENLIRHVEERNVSLTFETSVALGGRGGGLLVFGLRGHTTLTFVIWKGSSFDSYPVSTWQSINQIS